MGGGHPKSFFTAASLKVWPVEGEAGWWEVQAEEQYLQQPADLFSVRHVAGAWAGGARFDALRADASLMGVQRDAHTAVRELRARATRSGSFVDAVCAWQGMLSGAAHDRLSVVAKEVFGEVTQWEEAGTGGVHWVTRSDALVYRLKFAAVMVQHAHDARLRHQVAGFAAAAHARGELDLASSAGLLDGLLLGDAYVGPLLGALSPWVWGFSASTLAGTLVYSFGHVLPGRADGPAELLQVLPQQSPSAPTAEPELPPEACSAAVSWWAERLNELFATISDPGASVTQDGVFDPLKQAHAAMSVEQLFRRVAAIQVGYRDVNACRALLFTVLDTLDRLTAVDIKRLCSGKYARERLEAIQKALPNAAAPVLLPAAERAVRALEGVQDGFFLCPPGTDSVIVPQPDGAPARTLNRNDAAAEYLKLLRNATHGHGTNRPNQTSLTNALLAQHNGHVPHDVALLGYLYLLDLLTNQPNFANRLRTRRG